MAVVTWTSWCVAYGGHRVRVGRWTKNHRTSDGHRTLCGRTIPRDVFDIDRQRDPTAADCAICRRAEVGDQGLPLEAIL